MRDVVWRQLYLDIKAVRGKNWTNVSCNIWKIHKIETESENPRSFLAHLLQPPP